MTKTDEIVGVITQKAYPPTKAQALKVFGFISIAPDIVELFDDRLIRKMTISVVPGYSMEDAVRENQAILDAAGKGNFYNGMCSTWRYFHELVPKSQFDQIVINTSLQFREQIESLASENLSLKSPEAKMAKEKEKLVAYVRYVFENADPSEKEVMESVLSKFTNPQHGKTG